MANKIKALILLSGGLDSILASKLLLNLGLQVTGVTFESPFWNTQNAQKEAQKLRIDLIILDFERDYLKMLKNPKYGYGSGFNPCIDCHILMIKHAWQYAKKHKFDFVATGEVLGERPMSQNRESLEVVSRESKVRGYLLRPLSAKLLDETIPEKKGWVDREKLLDIKGRSRKTQLELAKKWGIKDFPSPAGGCLLTDPDYSERLRKVFKHWPGFTNHDAEIIKYGRNFWFGDTLILVGRHHEDNLKLQNLAQKSDILMKVKDHPGPIALIRNNSDKKSVAIRILKYTAKLTLKYAHLEKGEVVYGFKNKFDKEIKI